MSLQLYKLDLHVHTPASHDFVEKSVTASDIVEHCLRVGLHAIAVTDHNTVDYVDKLKAAAEGKGLTIFPGLEISCGATQSGSIHVIALFDPSVCKDDLQKVLGKVDVAGMGKDALTQKSPADVVEIIHQSGGLPVLAHANSTHGALSDIRGHPRTALVKNKSLIAVEATSSDFEKPAGKRLLDVLDGDDPVYGRKLAVYKASDNPVSGGTGHCLETIGSRFTYFRMGAPTLESLRECFEDRDSRIVQDYETDKIGSAHPRIERLEIKGGFLDSQKVPFHQGMNSIIGGTGTGKSLTIELLRFVFDRKPPEVLMPDHRQKLQKQLRINGEVIAYYRDGSGSTYKVTRKLENPRDPYSSAISCTNVDTGKIFKGDLPSLAPLLVYSQNEILEITRDENAQLRLLDNFRDFETHQNQVTEIQQSLSSLDQRLNQAIQDSVNCDVLRKQLQNAEISLEKLSKQLGTADTTKKSKPYLALSAERTAIEEQIEEFDPLLDVIDEAVEGLGRDMPTGKVTSADTLATIERGLRKSYSRALEGLTATRVDIVTEQEKARGELRAWDKKKKYLELEKAYKATIKLKKKEEELETKRRTLLDEKKALVARITQSDKAAQQQGKFRSERAALLKKLAEIKARYFDERSRQAEFITTKSGGKLRIVVQAGDNKSEYVSMLKSLAVGSYAEKKELEAIANSVSPVEFVDMVLDGATKSLSTRARLSELKAETIVKGLNEPGSRLATLAMQYNGFPEDRIEISYQKRDGQYYPLSELSMGQKADALIMIALGDGTMPVVIDQPEDALDIPSIWADICSRLRISKHVRQFVFTTHNSSISVSSDSDQFIVFEADGRKGWIARSGSIDEQIIKDDVVSHLEGGYKSYELKRKKYGL